MKVKLDCEVIQDMLPLYEEQRCSEKTKELVEFHLKDCRNCQQVSKLYQGELPVHDMAVKEPDAEVIKAGMSRMKRKKTALCIVPVGILVVLMLLYSAFAPFFKASVPFESCRINVLEVAEPEVNIFDGRWGQNISVEIEYSESIKKSGFDFRIPGISLMWQDAQVMGDEGVVDVLLVDVTTSGFKNVWVAKHQGFTEKTRTSAFEINSSNADSEAKMDAIYYVENLNEELVQIFGSDEYSTNITADIWTELVEEKGQLVWSAETNSNSAEESVSYELALRSVGRNGSIITSNQISIPPGDYVLSLAERISDDVVTGKVEGDFLENGIGDSILDIDYPFETNWLDGTVVTAIEYTLSDIPAGQVITITITEELQNRLGLSDDQIVITCAGCESRILGVWEFEYKSPVIGGEEAGLEDIDQITVVWRFEFREDGTGKWLTIVDEEYAELVPGTDISFEYVLDGDNLKLIGEDVSPRPYIISFSGDHLIMDGRVYMELVPVE